MAGYFGFEIILDVDVCGLNWLGQTYVFAQASKVLGRFWVNSG